MLKMSDKKQLLIIDDKKQPLIIDNKRLSPLINDYSLNFTTRKAHFFPSYYDPLFGDLGPSKEKIITLHPYCSKNMDFSVGNITIAQTFSGQSIICEGNHVKYEINKDILYQVERGKRAPLLSYDTCTDHFASTERIPTLFAQADPHLGHLLDYFIGTVEGKYVIPCAYTTKEGWTIVNKPIGGKVLIRTCPDTRFYLSYERSAKGVLVGKCIRSRLIPMWEHRMHGETEEYIQDAGYQHPVYVSYYDPGGSGRCITKEEYEYYMRHGKTKPLTPPSPLYL